MYNENTFVETTIKSFDGTELSLCIDTPKIVDAVCIIVHGLCEHKLRYNYVVQKMLENNVKVYRFDLRGHGKSAGERAYLSNYMDLAMDTDIVVDMVLKENPNTPCFLLGHSMGGFTVAIYGTKYQNKINGIILSGAFTRDNKNSVKSVLHFLPSKIKVPNKLGKSVCSDKKVVEEYKKDKLNTKFFTIGLCQQLKKGIEFLKNNTSFSYPVLILHGNNDVTVSKKDSEQFFEEIDSTDKEIKIFDGAMHEIFNEFIKDEVISDVINWLSRRINK